MSLDLNDHRFGSPLPFTVILGIQILASFFSVVLPSCLKFKTIEEKKIVANTAKIDTYQTDSKIVKFICGLFRKRAVGISESKLSIIGKKLGKFSLHDVIRFQIINMLPLFASCLLIQNAGGFRIRDYVDVATLI